MGPEADDRHDRKQQESGNRALGHARTVLPPCGCEYDEREHQPSRGLYADPKDEQSGACAEVCRVQAEVCGVRVEVRGVHGNWHAPRARGGHLGFASRERQRPGQDQQHERVVVRTAHGKLQQHGIQADEDGSNLGRASHIARRARRQRDRPEAACNSQQLQAPQPAAEPKRGERIGAEREQGSVGRMLERPADEGKDGVGWSFGRDVCVGVEPVQQAHPSELEVAEDVLGDERRPKQQQKVGRQNGKRDRLAGQRAGGEQRRNIAGAHHKRQQLEAGGADANSEPVQRSAQPPRPAPDASRYIGRRATGGA